MCSSMVGYLPTIHKVLVSIPCMENRRLTREMGGWSYRLAVSFEHCSNANPKCEPADSSVGEGPASRPVHLSSIPGAHIVGGENQFLTFTCMHVPLPKV